MDAISKADLDFYGKEFFNNEWFKQGVIETRQHPEQDKQTILDFDHIWNKHKHHFILDTLNEPYLKRIVLCHLFDARGPNLKGVKVSSLNRCINTAKDKPSWHSIAVNRPSLAEECFNMAPKELQIRFIKMVCNRIRTGDTSYHRQQYKKLSKELYSIKTTFRRLFKEQKVRKRNTI